VKRLLAPALLLFLTFSPTALAQSDPCAGVKLAGNEVGLNYEGHCVAAQTDGPPIQSVIVQRTEDLDGVEVVGILIVRTLDGWVIADTEFYLDEGAEVFQVGDSRPLYFGETE
jgi:hypothetical protein